MAKAALRKVYPEKCAEIGDAALDGMISHGTSVAQSHSITSKGGVALLIAHEFVFGHACSRDQLYPWIGATLKADMPTNAHTVRRLATVHGIPGNCIRGPY